MDPYRTTSNHPPLGPRAPEPSDDRAILWFGLVVGAIECVAEMIRGGRWGAQGTLGLLLFTVTGFLLVQDHRSSSS